MLPFLYLTTTRRVSESGVPYVYHMRAVNRDATVCMSNERVEGRMHCPWKKNIQLPLQDYNIMHMRRVRLVVVKVSACVLQAVCSSLFNTLVWLRTASPCSPVGGFTHSGRWHEAWFSPRVTARSVSHFRCSAIPAETCGNKTSNLLHTWGQARRWNDLTDYIQKVACETKRLLGYPAVVYFRAVSTWVTQANRTEHFKAG